MKQPNLQPGSSIATLWLQVNEDDRPPASIPSTLLPLKQCPQCSQALAPPLKTSGRQVCMKCGWSDQPRGAVAKLANKPTNKPVSPPISPPTEAAPEAIQAEVANTDLLQLLEKAASESLENMKPRKKPNPKG